MSSVGLSPRSVHPPRSESCAAARTADPPRGAGLATAEEMMQWSSGRWLEYVDEYPRAFLWAVGERCQSIDQRAVLHSVIGPVIRG